MNKTAILVLATVVFATQSGFAAPSARKSKKAPLAPHASAMAQADLFDPAHAPLAGTIVRPLVGINFMNPKGFNNQLQTAVSTNQSMKVGTGPSFGIAAEYPVIANQFYAGLRIEHFSSASDSITTTPGPANPGGAAAPSTTLQASISGTPVMATGTWIVPLASKWNFGSTLGAGLGFGYKVAMDVNGSTTAAQPNGTLAYGGTPFTGLVAASLNYDINSRIGVRLESGYRMLSSKQMAATDNYGTGVKEGELLRDANSQNISVDASSFFTGLSMAITL